MPKLSSLAEALADQVASNRSALGHEAYFASHRARLTAEIAARAPAGGAGRLCLIGAGNANDVDLASLAAHYREIHLVDVDGEALRGAVGRLPAADRPRFVVHGPLDASGMFEYFEAWSRTPPSSDEITGAARAAVEKVVAALPGPFDVAVSCCLLTQLQLVLLETVGDGSPRFDELRAVLGRTHVRTLAGLLAPGGLALLVTDLTGSATYPFAELPPDANLAALMGDLLAAGNVIHAAHPGLLSAEIRRDPALKARYAVRFPIGPWLWRNGPDQIYLVYGLEIAVRSQAGQQAGAHQ